MMRISGVLLSILLVYEGALAQSGNYLSGARSRGISGTSMTLSDAFASMNNIGALAAQPKNTCFFNGSLLYGIPGLNKIGLGVNCKLPEGIATVNFFRFGDRWFSEYKAGLGFSHQIRFISLGLQLDYVQYRMLDYGSSGFLGIEMGGLVKISSRFLFGAYLFNPLLLKRKEKLGNFTGALLKSGISYRPSEGLMLNVESHYYVQGHYFLMVGFEYVWHDTFFVRTGFNLETLKSSFGFGFQSDRFRLDYAIDLHPVLGLTHELSVTLEIGSGR